MTDKRSPFSTLFVPSKCLCPYNSSSSVRTTQKRRDSGSCAMASHLKEMRIKKKEIEDETLDLSVISWIKKI